MGVWLCIVTVVVDGHYGNPKDGCDKDEDVVTIYKGKDAPKGKVCAALCNNGTGGTFACPQDTPAGTDVKYIGCLLGVSDPKTGYRGYCGLECAAGHTKCPKGAVCRNYEGMYAPICYFLDGNDSVNATSTQEVVV